VALFLNQRGFHAFALVGGYNAWTAAGLPLDA
jgi:rhodanese-related sulfurtransferase